MTVLSLGHSQSNRPVRWNFTTSSAGNRHLLLTGCSGSGKSYLLRHLLQQASAAGHAVFILDLTGEYSTLPTHAVTVLDPTDTPLGMDGFPLPPWKAAPQHHVRQAETMASLFSDCFSLSSKQHHLLYTAALQYLSQTGASSIQDFLSYFLSGRPLE